jgi:hypothetical protein
MSLLPTLKDTAPSPLRIAEISFDKGEGGLGMTICPGKKDLPYKWNRDLEEDLSLIRKWGASTVVTLIEAHEFELLKVGRLGELVQKLGMRWIHLPSNTPSLRNNCRNTSELRTSSRNPPHRPRTVHRVEPPRWVAFHPRVPLTAGLVKRVFCWLWAYFKATNGDPADLTVPNKRLSEVHMESATDRAVAGCPIWI